MSYLGYRGTDADTEYGRFFNPDMADLPRHVVRALQHGPQAGPVLPDFDEALTDSGYQQTENGYGVGTAVVTPSSCAPICRA